jgi:hypothetical protein
MGLEGEEMSNRNKIKCGRTDMGFRICEGEWAIMKTC